MVIRFNRFEPTAELVALIQRRIRRRVSLGHFSRAEEDDLLQDVHTHLQILNQRPAPSGLSSCAERIVLIESFLSNLARNRRALKRSPPQGLLLRLDEVTMTACRSPKENIERDMRLDCEELLRIMPKPERELAADLMQGRTVSDVSRLRGTPCSTLRDRMQRIRTRFERRGLAPNC